MTATDHLAEASFIPQVSTIIKIKGKKGKTMKPILVASVSHADTSMILEVVGVIFRLLLLWGTNTPENADNPDEGAFIDHAYGITCEELDAHAFDDLCVIRQGVDWKLEVDVCDVFAEFVFTPAGSEPIMLSVSMNILRGLDAVAR